MNRTYEAYTQECMAHYASLHGDTEFDPSPIFSEGGQLVQGALSSEVANAHVDKITHLIESNDSCVDRKDASGLSIGIKEPLVSLGANILDCLRSPSINTALLNFFHSNYRVEWATCYRSVPSQEIAGSWYWHSDSYPPHTLKMFLHLTPATAETGATEIMNREDTLAYRKAGYFGQQMDERLADLTDFAKKHNIPYRPHHFDAAAGDVTLLNSNFFHRAVAPRTNHRDIISFFLVPNILTWEEQIEKDGISSTIIPKGGVPKNPHPQKKEQETLVGSTM